MTVWSEAAFIYLVGTITFIVFIVFIVLIVIEYRKKQQEHIAEKHDIEHHYQQEVLKTQIEVQEQSFRYVSEEIHDNIAQTLSLAKLKLHAIADKSQDAKQTVAIENSADIVGQALKDLRNLSHVLNGGLVGRLSLQENLEKELNFVADARNIKTALFVSGSPFEIDPGKKLMIVRIVQEAVNNAVKHAEASEISVNLSYSTQHISVLINDDGKGFDISKMQAAQGLGLHNMQVRAKMLGDLLINSEANHGTTITLNAYRL